MSQWGVSSMTIDRPGGHLSFWFWFESKTMSHSGFRMLTFMLFMVNNYEFFWPISFNTASVDHPMQPVGVKNQKCQR
jgi:hypothetical protein